MCADPKFPKKFGAPRAENLRELGPRGCASLRISLQLFSESAYALSKITRESSVEMTQMSRKKRAKNLQNFRKSGTPRGRTNNLRALGQRALRVLYNVVES